MKVIRFSTCFLHSLGEVYYLLNEICVTDRRDRASVRIRRILGSVCPVDEREKKPSSDNREVERFSF